jgi:hypothetical protein
VNNEDLGSFVAVLRVFAFWRLARTANIEAVGNLDVHVLVGILRYAGPDDRKILFLDATRRSGIDERGRAGLQLVVSCEALGYQNCGRVVGFCR